MQACRGYAALGYGTLAAYGEAELQRTSRQVKDLESLGRRMAELPAVERAFAEGDLGWTKARELLRVVTPDVEEAWVERAKGLTNRQLEEQVARRRARARSPRTPSSSRWPRPGPGWSSPSTPRTRT